MFRAECEKSGCVACKISVLVCVLLMGAMGFIQLMNGFYKPALRDSSIYLYWVVDAFGFVIVPAILVGVIWKRLRLGIGFYGLNNPIRKLGLFKFLLYSIVSVVLYFAVTYVLTHWAWYFFPDPEILERDYQWMVPKDGISSILIPVYMATTAAIVETMVYAGAVASACRACGGSWKVFVSCLVITGTLFGLIHWENGVHEVVANAVLGAAVFWLAFRWKNIWPLIIAHFAVLISIYT